MNHYVEIYSGKKLISRKKLENMSKPQREDFYTNAKYEVWNRDKVVKLRKSKKELEIVP